MKPVIIAVLGALLILNLISFFLMGHDKQCAKKNQRRVSEKTSYDGVPTVYYDILKQITYPKVEVLSLDEFMAMQKC